MKSITYSETFILYQQESIIKCGIAFEYIMLNFSLKSYGMSPKSTYTLKEFL